MRHRHVVLIGLPGAGKTSIGRHLAKLLDRPFADADEQLELATGCTIPRLARERGHDELHRQEAQTLAELVGRDSHGGALVISAPGAVDIDRRSRALLARSAVVLWIRGSVGFLTGLGDPTHRPRLADGQREALARLERELAPLYAEVADHVVDVEPLHGLDGEPRHTIARHILRVLATGPLQGTVRIPEAAGAPPASDDERHETLARLERELAPRYADVADHVVDVERLHGLDGEPKRTIARHILTLLTRDHHPDTAPGPDPDPDRR
jgi:shikimate kinase